MTNTLDIEAMIDRQVLVGALHDVASQYLPRCNDYLIQRFVDRIMHEYAKSIRERMGDMEERLRELDPPPLSREQIESMTGITDVMRGVSKTEEPS